VTRQWTAQPGVQIPVGARDFPVLQRIQTNPVAHPASYSVGIGSFFGVLWPVHIVDHSPPSSAEVKDEETYASAPPYIPHGLDRDSSLYFTLLYLLLCLITAHNFSTPHVIMECAEIQYPDLIKSHQKWYELYLPQFRCCLPTNETPVDSLQFSEKYMYGMCSAIYIWLQIDASF
jgi:hypothetical protein